jgi:hypothetical protein
MLLPFQDFIDGNFTLRYQCQEAPQDVELAMRWDRPIPKANDLISLANVRELAKRAGGGDVFAPNTGVFEPTNFQFLEHRVSTGPEVRLRFRIGGVAPKFFRFVVDYLRFAHGGAQYGSQWLEFSWIGSILPTGDVLTVTENMVRSWVHGPPVYLEAWPAAGFEIERGNSERGVAVVIETKQRLDDTLFARLEDTLMSWPNLIAHVAHDDGSPVTVEEFTSFHLRFPRIGRKKAQVVAHYPRIANARKPSENILINMLAAVQMETGCLQKLTIRM